MFDQHELERLNKRLNTLVERIVRNEANFADLALECYDRLLLRARRKNGQFFHNKLTEEDLLDSVIDTITSICEKIVSGVLTELTWSYLASDNHQRKSGPQYSALYSRMKTIFDRKVRHERREGPVPAGNADNDSNLLTIETIAVDEESGPDEDTLQDLFAAAGLTEDEKTVMRYWLYDRWPVTRIAEIMQKSRYWVEKTIDSALRKLKRLLARRLDVE